MDWVESADATALSGCQKRETVLVALALLCQATQANQGSARIFLAMGRLVDAANKISRQLQVIGTEPVDDTRFEAIIGHLK